ncbi:MAG: lactonase family protein [Solirubrobacteraceae bacterium]
MKPITPLAALACAALSTTACGGSPRPSPGLGLGLGPRLSTGRAPTRLVRIGDYSRCTTAVTPALGLAGSAARTTALPGPPLSVAGTGDGRWLFASLGGDRLAVLSSAGRSPRLLRTVALPGRAINGLSVTHDGRYLLGAEGRGIVVLSVSRLQMGAPGALLGASQMPGTGSAGAARVLASLDDRYAFVTLEQDAALAVFRLSDTRSGPDGKPAFIGALALPPGPLGLAVSPDGRQLYVTSEGGGPAPGSGLLTVLGVPGVEARPSSTAGNIASAPAGCGPVRVAVSPDGRVVWVSARTSNEVIAFSAARLRSDPAHAELAAVRVGAAPLGLAFLDGGRRLLVADSDYQGLHGRTADLRVIDPLAVLAGRAATLGSLPSGRFPREIWSSGPGLVAWVAEYGSRQLRSVVAAQLP